MDFGSEAALLLGTLSIAALHALIPSHWLAFAVVGRAHRWPRRLTLTVTALAGTGHVVTTMILGLPLAAVGKAALKSIPPRLEHAAAAILLILLGLYFALSPLLKRGGHTHTHGLPGHTHDHDHIHGATVANRIAPTTIGALIMGMTLSPCLDLLPVYMAASTLPWHLIVVISILMAATTLGIMVGLVWLTLHGLEKLNLRWLERNEPLAVGGILIALGALLLIL